jgi:UDPglucose 6-dehydrogenase
MKTISVIGSGYVGVSTAAIAAHAGYKVYLLDVNPDRINVLKTGKSFFYEEGIDPLLKKAVASGTIIPTLSYEPAIAESEMVISCVGTPDNPDGSSNLEYIFAAAKTAAPLLRDGAVYVQKSTVPVGTGKEVKQHLPKAVTYVSNPEFLREGRSVYDTLHFDRIVVGGNDADAIEKVFNLYRAIDEHREEIAEISGIAIESPSHGKYIGTNLESAELIKVTANAFLALKISFANSIAKLADVSGADIHEVMDAVGDDARIGRAFLNAGRGYGGGCFPKDVSGLISSSNSYGVEQPILTAAQDINESMAGYIVEKAIKVAGALKGKKVAVLGLAFKPGTSDARQSPGAKIANILDKLGAEVTAYDPKANEEAKDELRRSITVADSVDKAISDAEILFITTAWPEFLELDYESLKSVELIVDAMNAINPSRFSSSRVQYIGVGRGLSR